MPKQKRKSITLGEKVKIINDIENGMKKSDVLDKYKISNYSNLTKIMKNKEKYINAISVKSSTKHKRLRDGKFKDLENELNTKIEESFEMNIPITGFLMQELAKEIALEKDVSDFKASNHWLQNFKKHEM
jgi:hypothetical protein